MAKPPPPREVWKTILNDPVITDRKQLADRILGQRFHMTSLIAAGLGAGFLAIGAIMGLGLYQLYIASESFATDSHKAGEGAIWGATLFIIGAGLLLMLNIVLLTYIGNSVSLLLKL